MKSILALLTMVTMSCALDPMTQIGAVIGWGGLAIIIFVLCVIIVLGIIFDVLWTAIQVSFIGLFILAGGLVIWILGCMGQSVGLATKSSTDITLNPDRNALVAKALKLTKNNTCFMADGKKFSLILLVGDPMVIEGNNANVYIKFLLCYNESFKEILESAINAFYTREPSPPLKCITGTTGYTVYFSNGEKKTNMLFDPPSTYYNERSFQTGADDAILMNKLIRDPMADSITIFTELEVYGVNKSTFTINH